MRERCMSGSVRGARGNLRPYRDRLAQWFNMQGAIVAPLPTRRWRNRRGGCDWHLRRRVGKGALRHDKVCCEFTACAPLPTLPAREWCISPQNTLMSLLWITRNH